ncbi:hypothetical protein JOL62DRAFT_609257 [Phyllosticta paracitricarpa]|uniref:Uncharacterized protein n=1 Tax=Phyllosticta paracitricarpa TaxID=2016321 RepID=A0ABR1NF68_9PEZI
MAALSKLVERAEDAEHPDYGPVFVVTLVTILFMAISILSSIIHFFTTPSARSFIPEWRAQPGARLYRTPRALEEAVPLTQPEPVVAGPSSSNGGPFVRADSRDGGVERHPRWLVTSPKARRAV